MTAYVLDKGALGVPGETFILPLVLHVHILHAERRLGGPHGSWKEVPEAQGWDLEECHKPEVTGKSVVRVHSGPPHTAPQLSMGPFQRNRWMTR